jgi:type II secretory pathway pseudopilin PulG
LVEVAVVIAVISVLLVIIAAPLAGQIERRRMEETQKLLDTAREALYGYAAANGRLPCPARADGSSNGQESPINGGACTNQVGLLPAVTLGMTPVDANGHLVDAWADGTNARRVGYAVSNSNSNAVTTANGIRNTTMAVVGAATHLYVCATGLTAAPPTTNCGTLVELTSTAPAVIFSLGRDTNTNSQDETNNQNGDIVFSSGTLSASFDDMVTWLSMNTLFSRMMAGGKLP